MAATIAQFEADISKFFKQIKDLRGFVQACTQDVCERVIEATPVDTGFLKGSWQPLINDEGVDTDNKYESAMVSAKIKQIVVGDQFKLVNGAAYAMRIEYGFVGPDSLGRVYNQTGRYTMTQALYKWPEIVAARIPEFIA